MPLQIAGIVFVPGPPGSAVVFVSDDKMPAGGHGAGPRCFRRHRPGAAPRTRKGVAHLRDALAAGRAHRTAEFHRFGIGVGVGEVRESLAGEEPAQRAVGESETRYQAVAAGLLHAQRAKTVAAGPVECEKRPRFTPGGRSARLDVQPRLLRAEHEDSVTARMVSRLCYRACPRNIDLADRDRHRVAVLAGVGRWGAGVPVVGAV